jgi:hypothetical protein
MAAFHSHAPVENAFGWRYASLPFVAQITFYTVHFPLDFNPEARIGAVVDDAGECGRRRDWGSPRLLRGFGQYGRDLASGETGA